MTVQVNQGLLYRSVSTQFYEQRNNNRDKFQDICPELDKVFLLKLYIGLAREICTPHI